jgi:hypothetical protein
MSSILNKISRGLELYTRFYLKRETPVLIYCTGRVGSIAMYEALVSRGIFTLKIEDLDPDNARDKRGSYIWTYRHIAVPRRPAKVIFIVRNPVALMVSDFLPKLDWITGERNAHAARTPQELAAVFNRDYFAQGRHTEKLDWFDNEPKRFLGIDVYAHPFDRDRGYAVFRSNPYDVLVVRSELDDAAKAQAVGQFVGVPDLTIPRINEGKSNHYGQVYGAFKDALTIDRDKIDHIHNSRWGQHFYSTEALAAMNAKWLPEPAD